MRIGILKTDDVLPQLAANHGEYDGMFTRLLAAADADLEFATFDTRASSLPALDDCDGWLVTGSRLSVYDDVEWIGRLGAFVRDAVAAERKLVGVCFGHQLVAHALDGKVEAAAEGWTVGVQELRMAESFPWAPGADPSVRLIHSHRDQVTRLPTGAVAVGGNARCPVALYRLGETVMCVQGHAEFTGDYARSLYAVRRADLGAETCDRAVDTLDGGDDSARVGSWIAAFFRYRSG